MDASLLFEPVTAGLVVAGTFVLAGFRNGLRGTSNAASQVLTLARPPFLMQKHRAELARQVARMKVDGVIRSEPANVTDMELADATAALVRHRSTDALIAEHKRHLRDRQAKRESAIHALENAGDLAPVMGLAGTLLALSQLPLVDLGGESALMLSLSQAVLSTFYGLILAHLALFPLAAAIERRGIQEESERDRLVNWLVAQLAPACPSQVQSVEREAA